MNILVFGQTGQVATELARHPGVVCLSRHQADLSLPSSCADIITTQRPDMIINAAAYTAVDRAETEPVLARTVNALAPAAMALAAAELDVPFVHISTDYVFDGSGSAPWHPTDHTRPLQIYGQSKLEGEEAVAAVGGRFGVLRTSWVFSAHGSNFVKTMLRLAQSNKNLRIVADQIGAPTPARAIAAACLQAALSLRDDTHLAGVYHFAGNEDTSWAGFARRIFEQANITCDVAEIPTSEYQTSATRPLNSRLDCQATAAQFGLTRPDWGAALAEVIRDLG